MAHERPLVVVKDETLLDDVLRLAAAVGCEIQRAPDILAARSDWSRAPLILLDEESLHHELPPRPGLLLVTTGAPDAPVWQRAFDAGIERVVPLPDREANLVGMLADVAEGPGVPGGCVIGVIGGRGGAGASVFAAALALAAATDRDATRSATADDTLTSALLIDCDPLSGGLDMTLGAETAPGARWPALRLDGGRISMPTLREALPEYRHRRRAFPFLSCDTAGPGPTRAAVASVVDAGHRAGAAVVCDLPRHLGPAAEAVLPRADLLVMVVPADIRACAAARRVAEHIKGALPAPPHAFAEEDPPSPALCVNLDDPSLTKADIEALESLLASSPLRQATKRKAANADHPDESAPQDPDNEPHIRPEDVPGSPPAHGSPADRSTIRARPDAFTSNPYRPPTADQPPAAVEPATPPSDHDGVAASRRPGKAAANRHEEAHASHPNGRTAGTPTAPHPAALCSETAANRLPLRRPTTTHPEANPRPNATTRRLTYTTPRHPQPARLHQPVRSYADRLYIVVRGPAPTGLTPQEVAHIVQLPLLASMAADRKLAKALERGAFVPRNRSPLLAAARFTLAAARAEGERSGAPA